MLRKYGALVFACPRDNGANALQRVFREVRHALKAHDWQSADAAYRELVQRSPAAARPRRGLGNALLGLGKIPELIESLSDRSIDGEVRIELTRQDRHGQRPERGGKPARALYSKELGLMVSR